MSTPTETRLREAVKLLRAACRRGLARLESLEKYDLANFQDEEAALALRNAITATSDLDQEPMP